MSGHGLDDVIAKHFAQSAAFFNQPPEFKQEIAIQKTRFHRCCTCPVLPVQQVPAEHSIGCIAPAVLHSYMPVLPSLLWPVLKCYLKLPDPGITTEPI